MNVRSILALSLAPILAGCAAGAGATAAAPDRFATVKDSYSSFRDALAKDDYDAAYEALSRETRDRYPSQVFWIAFNMTSTGQHYRRLIATSVLVASIEKKDGVNAVAILRAKDPGSDLYEMKSFRVVKENGRWLVSFTLQEFFGIPEDEFFDLEKVAENRDFRHRR